MKGTPRRLGTGLLAALSMVTLGTLAHPARAAFTLLDDFSEANGTALSGKASDLAGATWSADSVYTVQDGTLYTNTGNKRVMLTLPTAQAIADNSVGTLFVQVTSATGQFTIGPADNNGSGSPAYNVNSPIAPLTFNYPSTTGTLATAGTTVGSGYTKGGTYNVWIVMNTAADTYSIYIQGGTQYATQTEIVTNKAFANPQTAAVRYLAFRTNSFTGPLAFDNVYLDKTAVNLADPTAVSTIPTPAALSAGLALLGLAGLRRRI